MTTTTTRRDRASTVTQAEYVTFRLARQWIGIPVMIVQEVLVPQRIATVPLAPPAVAGFLNLRGQLVTSIDLRNTLGLEARDPDADYRNIVVRHEDELFALMADDVGDVVTVENDAIEPPPTTLAPRWRTACLGIVRRDEGLLVVMDIQELLRPDSSSE